MCIRDRNNSACPKIVYPLHLYVMIISATIQRDLSLSERPVGVHEVKSYFNQLEDKILKNASLYLIDNIPYLTAVYGINMK